MGAFDTYEDYHRRPLLSNFRDHGRLEPLDGLLNHLRQQKERHQSREVIRYASRRGCYAIAALVLVLFIGWLRSGRGDAAPPVGPNRERIVHCFFLIDRTGSMSPLRQAVLSGFNSYVEQQQNVAGSMLLTVAQFNSESALDLRVEARDVHTVRPWPLREFEPRGKTPLYDALALLIEHATRREKRAETVSEVVIVVFTDGHENASRRHSREQVGRLIEERRRAGWTFVFLGANQGSYTTSSALSIAPGATSNFVADARGIRLAWEDLSSASSRARAAVRSGQPQPAALRSAFLEGSRTAEADYKQRGKLVHPQPGPEQDTPLPPPAGSARGHRAGGGRRRRRTQSA